MDLCSNRQTYRGHGWSASYCRRDKVRCSGFRQLICTAPDIWPVWACAAVVLGLFIVAAFTE